MSLKRKCRIPVIILILSMLTQVFAIDEAKIQEFTLKNGLHIITYEMHSAPMIYSRLTYNVGGKYEAYGQTGISHIVEHMMFKGTDRFPKGSIAKLISANGGIFNAYTSNDITVYYEFMPKNKIDLAFDIESQRMHKCKFDPEEFEKEISVIVEERKQRTENQARGKRREEVNTLIYKNHPYRNPVIGWMRDIQSITRDEAYEYYKTYYTPNNATLVLCGDFNTEEILAKVKKYFGSIPKGPELEQPDFYRVDPEGQKILKFEHPDILKESLQMYFHAPTRFQEDGAALYVMGKILAGRSSTTRLSKRLVRGDKTCSTVGGGLGFSKDPRTFGISSGLMKTATFEEVEKAIWEEVDSLKNYPVSDYDLQKIKNKINFSETTGEQYISQVGDRIGTYENYIGWEYINKWNDMVMAVTKDDIMAVTKKYIRPENMVVCYSMPDTTKNETVPGKAGSDDSDADESDTTVAESDTLDTEISKPGFFKRILLGKKADVREYYKPTIETISTPAPVAGMIDSLTLDNGIKVYFLENHDFPTFYLIGFAPTGRIMENYERPGIKSFTEKMLNRGTENFNYNTLLEERSFTPYQAQVGQGWENITVQGYSLIKDTDKMLNGLCEMLMRPTFPEEEMEKIRPRLVSSAEDYGKTDDMKAFYGMFNKVFEGHQYNTPHAGDAETFKVLNRDDLVKFYDKYYSPDGMKLVVVGDFTKEWLNEKLNGTIGQWEKKSGDPKIEFGEIEPIEGKTVIVFSNPEYKQCRVDVAFNPVKGGIKADNKDIEAIRILEYILCGSSLTSRMGVELRDKQGLSYGVKSNLWIRQHGGYWNIRTRTDKEYANRMIKGMFEEIRKVQENGVTAEELENAKSRKLALLALQTRTADDIGGLIFKQLRHGQPMDHFDKSAERLKAVTLEDVQRVANKYLDVENYVIAVSGDLEPNSLDEFKK